MPNPTGNSSVIMSSDLTFITNEPSTSLRDRFGVLLGDSRPPIGASFPPPRWRTALFSLNPPLPS